MGKDTEIFIALNVFIVQFDTNPIKFSQYITTSEWKLSCGSKFVHY